MFDFHTHNLDAPAGEAVINLPREVLLCPEGFAWRDGALYSAGIHPWWTDDAGACRLMLDNLERIAALPQVVAVGECGFDRLRGDVTLQETLFAEHVRISEHLYKPVTVHCVRAFDMLLAARKALRPRQVWTVHGFRGRPALARQLLSAGIDLSFGSRYDADSYSLTPPERRHRETDEDF